MTRTVSFILLYVSTLAGSGIAQEVTRIAFGSCADQDSPQPVWSAIAATRPDLFLFLGDNIYGDTDDMAVLKAKYEKLAGRIEFRDFRARVPLFAIWDDHDYGVNDGGREYPWRRESQRLFLDFFREPLDSPRRRQEGIYFARIFGAHPHRVQVIGLDTRYHRDLLRRRPEGGGYLPDPDPAKTMLGEAQWKWLEEQLAEPAELRILASSIQFLSDQHRHEKWGNLPLERERLLQLLRRTRANDVIIVSGDMHFAEISQMSVPGIPYPLYDVTASGLTHYETIVSETPNRYRLDAYEGINFGSIEVDWTSLRRKVSLSLHDATGARVRSRTVLFP